MRAHRAHDALAAVERGQPREAVSGAARAAARRSARRTRPPRPPVTTAPPPPPPRPRAASPAGRDARAGGTRAWASRGRGTARGSRRASRSSCARSGSAPPPHSSSSSAAGASERRRRTTASCSGAARCEAQASAISSSSRSGRARTTGSAWIGFADERRYVTSDASPAESSTRPSRTATACTMWRASTTSPRVTSTTIGSTAASLDDHPRLYASAMPELPEVEAWVRELDPLVSRAPIELARPGHVATLKTFDPPPSALDGRTFEGARRRGKNLLFPTADGELVLRVHLMSAGRLRYVPPGKKAPPEPMFQVRFADGGELDLTEGGKKKRAGVWLVTPDGLDAELAHLGPDALDVGRRRAGRDPAPRAPAAPSRSSATSARSRGSAARTRTRSSGRLGSRPSGSRPTSATTRSRRWRRRSTTISPGRWSSALEGKGDADVYRDPRPLRRALPAVWRDRSAASTSRSTRSRTARRARPEGACSRIAGSRGCSADPNRRSSLPGWRDYGSTASRWRTRSPGTAHLSSSCTRGSPIGRCGRT